MLYLLLIIPFLSFAGVIQDNVNVVDRAEFSFRTVCARSVTHESPLIEAVSGTEIDCMGKKVKAGAFCEKELAADPYYLRGYVDKEHEKVICVSGKKVLFKYLCVKLSDKDLCTEDSKKSCLIIQDKLAKRLDMIHHSYVKNEKGIRQLNCFFESLPLKDKQ